MVLLPAPPPQPFDTVAIGTSASGSAGHGVTGFARVRSLQRVSLRFVELVVQKWRRREVSISTIDQVLAPCSAVPPSLHVGAAEANQVCVPV